MSLHTLPNSVIIWRIGQSWHDHHLRSIADDKRLPQAVRDGARRRWQAKGGRQQPDRKNVG